MGFLNHFIIVFSVLEHFQKGYFSILGASKKRPKSRFQSRVFLTLRTVVLKSDLVQKTSTLPSTVLNETHELKTALNVQKTRLRWLLVLKKNPPLWQGEICDRFIHFLLTRFSSFSRSFPRDHLVLLLGLLPRWQQQKQAPSGTSPVPSLAALSNISASDPFSCAGCVECCSASRVVLDFRDWTMLMLPRRRRIQKPRFEQRRSV